MGPGGNGEDAMLTLYDGTTSVCAIKVRLVLFEKSMPFESRTLDLRAGDQFDPEYLKLNPGAVVPTLDDAGEIVVESSVIMHYLDDIHPNPTLLPTDPKDRARMRLWMKRMDDRVHPATGTLTHATLFRPGFLELSEEEREARLARIPDAGRRARFAAVYKDGLAAPIVIDAVRTLDRLVRDMEAALSTGGWLAGPAYSLADAAATPYANRLRDLGLLGLWAGAAPRVQDWYERVRARPSFAPAVTGYLTAADTAAFEAMEPDTADRVGEILAAG